MVPVFAQITPDIIKDGPISTAADRLVDKTFKAPDTRGYEELFSKDAVTKAPLAKPAPAPGKTAPAAAINWKYYGYAGLLFEFPVKPAPVGCTGVSILNQSKICGEWSESKLSIEVTYRTFPAGSTPQTVAGLASDRIAFIKRMNGKYDDPSQYKNEPFTINAGEARSVVYNDTLSLSQHIYIRRGEATWEIRIFQVLIGTTGPAEINRLIASIRFKE